MTKTFFFFSLTLLFFAQIALGQNSGNSFYRAFSKDEYKGSGQNWKFVKDKRGIIYVANTQGILQYDGENWKKIEVENGKGTRAIAIDSRGRIYYGSPNSFGYLAIDSLGNYQTIKISQDIEEKYDIIPNIWRIRIIKDEIFFQSLKGVFKFTPYKNSPDSLMCSQENYTQNLQAFLPQTRFDLSFVLDSQFFITDTALMFIKNDTLLAVPHVEELKKEVIYGATPFKAQEKGKKSFLLALREKMLIYTPKSESHILKPFHIKGTTFFEDNIIYGLNKLPNDHYLISSIKKGAILVDEFGNVLENFDEQNGLLSNVVFSTYYADKSLWFALSSGITKFEVGSDFRFWDKSNGIKGDFNDVILFEDRIYVGTNIGVFVKDSSSNQFNEVENSVGQTTKFFSFYDELNKKNRLLATQGTHLLEIEGNKAKSYEEFGAIAISKSSTMKNTLLVGDENLHILKVQKGKNDFLIKKITGLKGNIRNIVEDKKGNIWVATAFNWVYKIDKTDFFAKDTFNIHHLDTLKGLSNKESSRVYLVNDEIYVVNNSKYYKYNELDNTFARSELFGVKQEARYDISYEENGNIWLGNSVCVTPLRDGTYAYDSTIAKRLNKEFVHTLNQISENRFLLCTDKRVYQYDRKKPNPKPYYAFVRKIMLNTDSVLFDGDYFDKEGLVTLKQPKILKYVLPYEDNSLSFAYAAAFFEAEDQTEYIYKLKGYKNKWSKWTEVTEKEYTNLYEGSYTFMVQARNVYGDKSEIGTFEFTILAPLYRTWWAYVAYILILIVLIWAIVKVNARRLIKEKMKLEDIVTERTAELFQQKEEILVQAEHLLEANDKLENAYTNVQLLNEIGQKITKKLSVEDIIDTVYQNVNQLMDAEVFAIGIFNTAGQRLDFYGAKESEQTLPFHFDELKSKNQLSVHCYKTFETIILRDSDTEIRNYLSVVPQEAAVGKMAKSLIYLPLGTVEKKIGVITVQSFSQNAYTGYHLNILRNIAIYTEIALENADSYQQINKQHGEIKSSLNYASTIQNAILPPQEHLDSLVNNFVIYRPKDIVSGDFYWLNKVNDAIFVAVVDCTGHGVPGAFMSMIGNRLLSEIVNEKKIVETNEILEELNIGIKKALRQEQTDNTDGMDVCLCKIEKNDTGAVISFTGAKNPLYVYQNDKSALLRIRGDKKAIGGNYFQNLNFSQTKISLKTGDMIYLTTDGFVDQNNMKRKKYSTKRLTLLLEKIQSSSLLEQKERLETELDEWQGHGEQRDDITILGIRI